jgi:hypothetical protein
MIIPPLSGISLGSCNVIFVAGPGDPNQSTTDDRNGSLASAGIGSHFCRTDVADTTHQLYIRTSLGANGWTNK